MRTKSKLIVIIVVFLAFKYFINIYTADVHYAKARKSLKSNNPQEALYSINKAISLNKQQAHYFKDRARIYITLILSKEEIGQEEVDLKKLAYNDLVHAVDLNENNLIILRDAVPLYFFLAVDNLNMVPGDGNIDPEYLPVTESYYLSLKNKYVKDAGVISQVAKYEKKLGLEENYAESVKIIRGLRADLLGWHESFR